MNYSEFQAHIGSIFSLAKSTQSFKEMPEAYHERTRVAELVFKALTQSELSDLLERAENYPTPSK